MKSVATLAKPAAPPVDYASDRRYQRTLLGVVMLAVTAFGSLMTLVTVALGTIGDDLGASQATITWTITGLMLVMATVTPIAGTLGDVHGHRKVFLIGLAGGAVATLLCGLAWDAQSLIAFRVLFGFFAAAVNPNGMALMMHAYGIERRAAAIGWFQFAMTGAPSIGLVVGGPLIELAGWRTIFFLFAGMNLLAFLVGLKLLRPIPRQEGRPLDVAGSATLAFAVLTALLAITRIGGLVEDGRGSSILTDPRTWILSALCVAGIAAFVRVERRTPSPMLKLDYFRERNFSLPMVSGALVQFAYMGGFVITPALLERRYGWMVGAIALLMIPRPGVFSIASPIGGMLPGKIGLKLPVLIGGVLMVASMFSFAVATSFTSGTGIALIVIGLVLSGAAAGLSQPSIVALAVNQVDEADVGVANGMNQQVMFIGILAGMQAMSVLIGDNSDARTFAVTYIVGLVIAALGLAVALGISTDEPDRQTEATG